MKLPVVSGFELIKAFTKTGYQWTHTKGSHANLWLPHPPFTQFTVPLHREVDKGTLQTILKKAGLTREQLDELL